MQNVRAAARHIKILADNDHGSAARRPRAVLASAASIDSLRAFALRLAKARCDPRLR
jgi:hypothetical protein